MSVLSNLRIRFQESEYVKNTFSLLSGVFVAQFLSIIISLVYARYYFPDDIGEWHYFISIISILAIFATGRYEFAIVLPEKEEDAQQLTFLIIILTITSSFVLLPIILVLTYWIKIIDLNTLSVILLPFTIIFVALFNTFSLVLNRYKKFKRLANAKIIQSVGSALLILVFGFLYPTSSTLILCWATGFLVANIYFIFSLQKYLTNRISLPKIKKVAKRYKKFPQFEIWSGLLNKGSIELPIIIITTIWGAYIAGNYAYAYKMQQLPLLLIGTAISNTYFQKANEIKKDTEKLKAFSSKLIFIFISIGIFPLLTIRFFGAEIFSFVLGTHWETAGDIASVLSPWLFVVFVTTPINRILVIKEKQKQNLIFNGLLFLGRISVLLFWGDNFNYTIRIFSYISTIIWIIILFYILRILNINTFKIVLPIIVLLGSIELIKYFL